MSTGEQFPAFRGNVVTIPALSGSQIWVFSLFLDCLNLKMEEPVSTEKSITVYQSKGHSIPQGMNLGQFL